MRRALLALPAGFAAAALITGMPVSAATSSIAVQDSQFNPSARTIATGDRVEFSWTGTLDHNVTWEDGAPGSGTKTTGTYEREFNTVGTFRFRCTLHSTGFGDGMSGSVSVQPEATGTGTTVTDTITDTTTTTGTQTTTQTQTTTIADTTAPSFLSRPKRRASRTALIVEVRSSEAATLETTVSRRRPGGRSFTRVGQAAVKVKSGRNVVKLPRRAAGSLRSGAYRVKLELVDAAGNRSGARTLNFKIA